MGLLSMRRLKHRFADARCAAFRIRKSHNAALPPGALAQDVHKRTVMSRAKEMRSSHD
jgi:hypothetical protein